MTNFGLTLILFKIIYTYIFIYSIIADFQKYLSVFQVVYFFMHLYHCVWFTEFPQDEKMSLATSMQLMNIASQRGMRCVCVCGYCHVACTRRSSEFAQVVRLRQTSSLLYLSNKTIAQLSLPIFPLSRKW